MAGLYIRVPSGRFSPAMPLAARFEAFTTSEPNTGCLLWCGSVSPDGYGKFQANGKTTQRAHRVAYELAHGPVPAGMVIRHRCDQPLCVRSEHLVAGSQRDNIADAVRRGRKAIGERHPHAKLTAEDVREIRARRAAGASCAALSSAFGVNTASISAVATRRLWRHVP